MLIELTKPLEQDGKTIRREAHLELEDIRIFGNPYKLQELEPIQLEITNLGKKVIRITGSAKVRTIIPCDRCLEDVEVKVTLDFKHKIDTESDAYDQSEDLDENNYIDGYSLDVEQLVYNELLVGWPTKILCSEDCKGICNVCGQNLNEGTCDCEDTSLDPRMSVIRDVFKNFKEV